jgi:hypothetical protein
MYFSLNIFRMIKPITMRYAGHVASKGEKRGTCGVLVGKPDRKRSFGRSGRKGKDNIKTDLPEVGCGHRLD